MFWNKMKACNSRVSFCPTVIYESQGGEDGGPVEREIEVQLLEDPNQFL